MRNTISRVVGIIRLAERELHASVGDHLATVIYGRVPIARQPRIAPAARRQPDCLPANLARLSRELDHMFEHELARRVLLAHRDERCCE